TSLLERVSSELGLGEDVLVAEYGPDQPVPRDVADITPAPEPDELLAAADAPLTDVPADDAPEGDSDEEEPATIPYDRRMQERRLRDAERKLAQLGRVNPLALEE